MASQKRPRRTFGTPPGTARKKAIIRQLRALTDKWRRVQIGKLSKTDQDALEDVIAVGAAEGLMSTAITLRGRAEKIAVHFTVAGDFHAPLATALDRLVPSAWKLPNGEPKQWLEKAGFLKAVRATNIGADYRARLESENPPEVAAALLNETVKEGIVQAWGKLHLVLAQREVEGRAFGVSG